MYFAALIPVVAVSIAGWVKVRMRRRRALLRRVARRDGEPEGRAISDRFSFIDHVPIPLLVLEVEGRLIFANKAAGMTYGDALASISRHPALQTALNEQWSPVLGVTRLELDVPVRRSLQARIGQLPSHEHPELLSSKRHVVVALDDVTEVATVQRMQADFIAYASHELRTPLASIIGLLETIKGPAARDLAAQTTFLDVMSRQAARMGRLIDRLLHLSRAQSLEHWRPETAVPFLVFWGRLHEEVSALQGRYAKDVKIPDIAPNVTLRADEDQLIQMMINLIENALKYAGKDADIRVAAVVDLKGGVFITVEDDGPGVETRHLPRLTERFYRVETGSAAGSGLGLAIVKHIVDRHMGRLRFSSELGAGLSCEIWLPIIESPTLSLIENEG